MKMNLTYAGLTDIADRVVVELRKRGPVRLIAIARGGLTFAQLVAYRMALPLFVYFPKNDRISGPESICQLDLDPLRVGKDAPEFVFLEDLVAKGRTYDKVYAFMDEEFPGARWSFVPVVLDANAPKEVQDAIPLYGMKTDNWVVFPYEISEHVVEGDRGLFREGTSNNSQEPA